jgi:2-methylisocitrate lyase-like PEP mutase family enzyme
MPCCGDALGAKLIEQGGFDVGFVSGFSVAAAHGMPDTGLLSYGEMESTMRRVCATVDRIPMIGDGDTGYGNAVNAKRTARGYAAAGLAGMMIEDQRAPKRCGHTRDKEVVDRDTAVARVRAAVDAARSTAGGLVIMARTDARETDGMDEAIARCKAFREAGAEITFLEAPRSVDELRRFGEEVPGWKMANLLAGGLTPMLPPKQLEAMGFSLAAYPLDLLNASVVAMRMALAHLRSRGAPPAELTLPFAELQKVVGFEEYYAEEARYRTSGDDP